MKFSDKLTLSSTAVIAILFSTGATFMMVQNHDHFCNPIYPAICRRTIWNPFLWNPS